MPPFELASAQIVVSLTTLGGLLFSLWKIMSTISSFTNRVDNMEEHQQALSERVVRMEIRHENNEAKINDIHVSIARLEGKIDFWMKQNK